MRQFSFDKDASRLYRDNASGFNKTATISEKLGGWSGGGRAPWRKWYWEGNLNEETRDNA